MDIVNSAIQVVLDILESMTVAFVLVLIVPFLMLNISPKSSWFLIRKLLPKGVLASFLRAKMYKKMGNYHGSALIVEQIIRVFEGGDFPLGLNSKESEALSFLYSELLSCYLGLGQLDQAASLVLRANGFIGCDGIDGYPEFTVQSAHIVKAGLAASRMLDERGLKKIFKTEDKDLDPSDVVPSDNHGKVIPFHRPTPK